MPTCTARKRDGSPCRANARAGESYCGFHAKDTATVRAFQAGRVAGGHAGAKTPLHLAGEIRLRTPEDLLLALEDAITVAREDGCDAGRVAFLQIAATRAACQVQELQRRLVQDAAAAGQGNRADFLDELVAATAAGESSQPPVLDLAEMPAALRAAVEAFLAGRK